MAEYDHRLRVSAFFVENIRKNRSAVITFYLYVPVNFHAVVSHIAPNANVSETFWRRIIM